MLAGGEVRNERNLRNTIPKCSAPRIASRKMVRCSFAVITVDCGVVRPIQSRSGSATKSLAGERTRLRVVDADDAGVGVRTVEDFAVEHSRSFEVGDEGGLALRQLGRVDLG